MWCRYLLVTRRFHHSSRPLEKQLKEIEDFFNQKRFANVKRPYAPIDVLKHRGSLGQHNPPPLSSEISKNLFELLESHFKEGKPLHTLGVLDPIQMTQLARCPDIKVAYVSGWACSSNANENVSPDFGDYPYDTVPNQVGRIFNAQQLHDKKNYLQNFSKNTADRGSATDINYMKPIIADADMGHGGITTVMKLAKMFAEKGASAIHLEDQLVGSKKCGHLSGTVVVPTSTHLQRLVTTRFQWDLMAAENLVIARTDSCNSKLISSTIDPRDHRHIQGIIPKSSARPLNELLLELENSSADTDSLLSLEEEWYHKNKIMTFDETVAQKFTDTEFSLYLSEKKKLMDRVLKKEYLSLREMKAVAEKVNPRKIIEFDWDYPRTKEGHYMFNGCLEAAIERSKIFAPYSDLIWLETKTPDLKQARNFSKIIHEIYPDVKFVYNLSPSFNWTSQGFDQVQLKNFIWDLAKEGFILQLVSLAGLHANGISFWQLANEFQFDGMASYVKNVQSVEKKTNCDLLTHQKWSGIEYVESVANVVQNGASSKMTSIGGDSFTENQF